MSTAVRLWRYKLKTLNKYMGNVVMMERFHLIQLCETLAIFQEPLIGDTHEAYNHININI